MRVGHVPVLVAEVACAFTTMPIPLRRLHSRRRWPQQLTGAYTKGFLRPATNWP